MTDMHQLRILQSKSAPAFNPTPSRDTLTLPMGCKLLLSPTPRP